MTDIDAPRRAPRRLLRPGWSVVVAAGVVGLPLLAALGALRSAPWHPVLDLAMTELRVRDVGTSHTPLIGLPGRIGTYPDQGSHPGPLSFYLLAPAYRLFGATPWALEAATVLIHIGAIASALWIGHRRARWRGVLAVAAVLAIAIAGYGQLPLTQPWNPYLPLLVWLVVLLATWSVLCGDHVMLIPLVIAATFCAQTHVPYLPLGAGMALFGLGVVVVRLVRGPPEDRRAPLRSVLWSVGIGAVLWLPPVIDQIVNRPGNLRRLADHFGSPPEASLGLGEGVELALRHLDPWSHILDRTAAEGPFLEVGSPVVGALSLLLWLGAVVVAFRVGSPALRALHVVVAVALVLGTISMSRIFGRPWYYLTLWAWGVGVVMAGAVVWTALAWWRMHRRAAPHQRDPVTVAALAAGAVAVVVSLVSAGLFAGAEHPEERLSDAVGTLAGPTYDAVVAGTGAATGEDGVYLVRWSDAVDIGSPGFGLLNELERRGLDVAADTHFTSQVTKYRVRARSEADAQIHLATGGYIDVWRAVPDAVEVAAFDELTPEERQEYADLKQTLIDRLRREGLADLVPQIETNLFGISVDTRLSAQDHADLARLVDLGQPMAVFIAPPPADADPDAL